MSDDTRKVPFNALDAQMQHVNPAWGQMYEIPEALQKQFERFVVLRDEQGRPIIDPETKKELVFDMNAWSRLAVYTRDLRMGNINPNFGEAEYCEHYIDLANDLMDEGMSHIAVISLSRAITKLEISQSRFGFFRKNEMTIRQETKSQDEPPKKSLFGMGKKREQYGS